MNKQGIMDKQGMYVTLPSNLDVKGVLMEELERAENPLEQKWIFNEWPVTHLLITDQKIILGSDDGKKFRLIFGLEIDGEKYNPVRDADVVLQRLMTIEE